MEIIELKRGRVFGKKYTNIADWWWKMRIENWELRIENWELRIEETSRCCLFALLFHQWDWINRVQLIELSRPPLDDETPMSASASFPKMDRLHLHSATWGPVLIRSHSSDDFVDNVVALSVCFCLLRYFHLFSLLIFFLFRPILTPFRTERNQFVTFSRTWSRALT